MRTKKRGAWRKMVSASDTLERARPFAAALIEREERHTGSRMSAYERVANMVGVSPSWLRKLIGRQPDVKEVAAHEFLNIAAAYRSLCLRIEAEAEQERRKATVLREQADAIIASASVVVVEPEGAERAGTAASGGDEA